MYYPDIMEKILQFFGEYSTNILVLLRLNRKFRDTLMYELPILSVPTSILHLLIKNNKPFRVLRELRILSMPSNKENEKEIFTDNNETIHNVIQLSFQLFPSLRVVRCLEHFLQSLDIDKSIHLTRFQIQCGPYLDFLSLSGKKLMYFDCEFNKIPKFYSMVFFPFSFGFTFIQSCIFHLLYFSCCCRFTLFSQNLMAELSSKYP